ncbi:uncharacterized protein LOC131946010 [Physella acuta]|uniref:uncharacterized protein LOC131946010 n=1 Tax=Physella acuta TaxID=109671 RepID=UPI0027DDF254|nr:uncharacterized protein LOC131946010 [Physella acuta]
MDEEKKDEPKRKPNARSPVRPKNYGQRPPAQNGRTEHRGRYPRMSSNHVSRTSNGPASQEMAMQFNQGPSLFTPSESNEASTQTQQNGGPVDQTNWFRPAQGIPAGLNDIGGLQDGPSNVGFYRTDNSQTFGFNDLGGQQDGPSNNGFQRADNSQTFGFNDLGRQQDGPSNVGFHNNQTLGFNDVGRLQDGTRPPNRHRTNNGQSPPRRWARRPQVGNASSAFNSSHLPAGSRSFGQASKNSSTRPAPTSHMTSQTADFQNPPVFVPESPQHLLPEIDSSDPFQSPNSIFTPEFDPFSSAAQNSGWSPLANFSPGQFLRGLGTVEEPFEFYRPDITVLSDEEIARQLQQEEWESMNTPRDHVHYGARGGFFSRARSTLPPIGRAEPGIIGRPHPPEPPVLRRGGQGSRGPGRGRPRTRYDRLAEVFSREHRDFTPLLVELFHSLEVPDFDLGALMLPGAGIDPDLGEYESLLALAERIGEVNRGLNQTDINSLPTTRFSHQMPDETTASAAVELPQCNICLTEYEEGEELRNLPCSHEFHSGCVDQWLLTNRTCPVCRSEVRQRS